MLQIDAPSAATAPTDGDPTMPERTPAPDAGRPVEPATPDADAPRIEPTFRDRLSGPDNLRIGAVIAAIAVLVVSAAVATGASPSTTPSGATASPGSSTAPESSAVPHDARGWLKIGRDVVGGRFGAHGLGVITIASISGRELSLETDRGWRRTVSIADDVAIRKGGDAITFADLAVGDRIALREERADDGTWSVTGIAVILPSVAGQVTAKTDSTITIRRMDDTTATIHVDGDTTYVVGRDADASLADVEVGMALVARGTERADGSLDADAVRAGTLRRAFDPGRGKLPWPGGPWGPDPRPDGDTTDAGSVG
jgi:hypothetical protein